MQTLIAICGRDFVFIFRQIRQMWAIHRTLSAEWFSTKITKPNSLREFN